MGATKSNLDRNCTLAPTHRDHEYAIPRVATMGDVAAHPTYVLRVSVQLDLQVHVVLVCVDVDGVPAVAFVSVDKVSNSKDVHSPKQVFGLWCASSNRSIS